MVEQVQPESAAMTFDEVSMERSKNFVKALQMVEQVQPESAAMTFDEVSMERSKNFVKALQELKNLGPQLYSAADYCEKSYLHNEQKQMVLDNLKDYTVRALVNAVDHLGTVAYKLSDLFEQQTVDASTVDLKITCLNQQILACEAYTDEESLKQHQLSSVTPAHHKHYVLPRSVNQKMQNSSPTENAERQNNGFQNLHSNSSDTASKTLSWHLASETKTDLDGASLASNGVLDVKVSGTNNRMLQAIDRETAIASSMWNKSQLAAGGPASNAAMSPLAAMRKGMLEANKSLVPFRSFDNPAPARRQNSRTPTPTRSRSVLSSLFLKHKSVMLKH